ncbi:MULTISPECIES: InlB B-repeat-containing protein [unclassified Paenibacillus]|uniref:InlB B-repeat-containing protein n=1 Tax=unclassified Paenibacillus TaxID=185978 RepID=UPI0030FC73E0
MTASPSLGYKFEKWMINGIEMGSPTISVFMDRDMDAIAYFSPISVMPKQFELVVEVVGQGKIDVTNDQTTVVYQDVQGTVGQFNEGSKVDAVMSPGQGYAFSKWVLNDLEVSDQSLQFIMDEDKLVQAYFEPVIVHPDPKGSITVEFVDQDTNSKVKADVTLTDLPLGNQSYTADSIIGIYKLIGDAVKQVVLSATEPFKRLPFFYKQEAVIPTPTPSPNPEPEVPEVPRSPEPTPTPEPSPEPSPKPTPSQKY